MAVLMKSTECVHDGLHSVLILRSAVAWEENSNTYSNSNSQIQNRFSNQRKSPCLSAKLTRDKLVRLLVGSLDGELPAIQIPDNGIADSMGAPSTACCAFPSLMRRLWL